MRLKYLGNRPTEAVSLVELESKRFGKGWRRRLR
jgi:hypothetical protein